MRQALWALLLLAPAPAGAGGPVSGPASAPVPAAAAPAALGALERAPIYNYILGQFGRKGPELSAMHLRDLRELFRLAAPGPERMVLGATLDSIADPDHAASEELAAIGRRIRTHAGSDASIAQEIRAIQQEGPWRPSAPQAPAPTKAETRVAAARTAEKVEGLAALLEERARREPGLYNRFLYKRTLKESEHIPAGGPHGSVGLGGATGPDGRRYTPDFMHGVLRIADAEGNDQSAIDGFVSPHSVAVSGDRVYVADHATRKVHILSADGDDVRVLEPAKGSRNVFDKPADLTVSGDRLYVADPQNSRVLVYDRDGEPVGQVKEALRHPHYVEADGDRLFVSDRNAHQVHLFRQTPEGPRRIGAIGTAQDTRGNEGFLMPGAVRAVGDTLYIEDRGNRRTQAWYSAGAAMAELLGELPLPVASALIDPLERLLDRAVALGWTSAAAWLSPAKGDPKLFQSAMLQLKDMMDEAVKGPGKEVGHAASNIREHVRRPTHLALKILALEAALSPSQRARFADLQAALKTDKSTEGLRTAMVVLQRVLEGKLHPAVFQGILNSPPKKSEDRRALEFYVHTGAGDRPQQMTSGPLDYQALKRQAVDRLRGELGERLQLNEFERGVLEGIGLSEAFFREGFFDNVLAYSSFQNNEGIASIKRLVMDLLAMPVVDGRFDYGRRYQTLEGQVAPAVYEKWKKDFTIPLVKPAPEPTALERQPASTFLAILKLGINGQDEPDFAQMAQRAEAKAAELARTQADSPQTRAILAGLRETLVPGLKQILDELEAGRAPPQELLKELLPIAGRVQHLSHVFHDPNQVLQTLKNLRTPAPKAADPNLPKLVVTDDPAILIRAGNDPALTCQRCTENTGFNDNGSVTNRILLGQMRLALWQKNGKPFARAWLELGKDNSDRDVVLVERLYISHDRPVGKDVLIQSLVEYGRELGAAAVYFGDASGNGDTAEDWGRIPGAIPSGYHLHSDDDATLYRDSLYKKGSLPAVPTLGKAAASPAKGWWQKFLGLFR